MENSRALLEQVGQLLMATWSESNPESAMKGALDRILCQLQTQLFIGIPISAAIMIYDDRKGSLMPAAACGPLKDRIEEIPPRPSGTSAHVFAERVSIFIDDAQEWPDSVPYLSRAESPAELRSLAMLPLLVGDPNAPLPIGVLTISSPQLNLFTDDKKNALQLFATSAAIAVQAARVCRRRLREQDALHMVSKTAAHRDQDAVAASIVAQAVQITKARYAVVFGYDKNLNQLSSLCVLDSNRTEDTTSIDLSLTLSLSDRSISTHVLGTREPYYAPNIHVDPHYRHHAPWDADSQSAYCVPLITRHAIVGVLYVSSEQENGFDDSERYFIDQLAPYAANAMRDVWLRETIIRFQQKISDVRSLDNQFTQIRSELENVGYDTSGLFIAQYDPETEIIRFPKVRDRGEVVGDDDARKQPGGLYGPRRLGERNGLVEWVLEKRKTLLMYDVPNSRGARQLDDRERRGLKACLVVPLSSENQIVGVLGLRRYLGSKNGRFDNNDRQFLETVANHIAVVLNNAEWRTRVQEQLDALKQIKVFQENIADTLSLTEQVRQIREQFQEIGIPIDGLFIATYDDVTKEISLPKVYEKGELLNDSVAFSKNRYGPRKFGERSGFIDWVIQHRETLFIADCASWDQVHKIDKVFRANVTSCLITPIWRHHKIIGVIGLRSYADVDRLTEQHKRFLENVAPVMGTVIDNAQKYDNTTEELRRRLKDVRAISEFQQGISNIDVTDDEILRDLVDITDRPGESLREIHSSDIVQRELANIYEQALEALGITDLDTRNMYIALCDDQQRNKLAFPLVYEDGARIDDQYRPAYQTREIGQRPDLTEWVISYGEKGPLLFRNRKEMEAWRNQPEHSSYFLPEFSKSWVGAPLRSRLKTIGMIGLRDFEKENAFTEEHCGLLEIIANQSGIVIENARLYQLSQVRLKQLNTLYKAANRISQAGLEKQRVLDRILEQAVRATGAYLGTLQEIVGDQLVMRAVWPEEYRGTLMQCCDRIPVSGQGITARSVREHKYQIVKDVLETDEYREFLSETRSELAVVLRNNDNDEVMGVLNVEHREPDKFGREDAHLLIALSHLAVVAIENARMYEESDQTNTIAIMGAWGAEIVHDVNREVGNIDATLLNIRDMLDEHDKGWLSIDAIKESLEQIDESIENLSLPELPDDPTDPDKVFSIEDAPLVNQMIEAELFKQRNHARQAVSGAPIRLTFCAACDDVRIKMDEFWFRRILNHFVHNGIRNMPEERVHPYVNVITHVEDEFAHITIADNGKGVRPEIRDRLFRMPINHSDQSAEQRAGRGLLLVDFVLKQHKGEAFLQESKIGEGSKFVIKIPLAA